MLERGKPPAESVSRSGSFDPGNPDCPDDSDGMKGTSGCYPQYIRLCSGPLSGCGSSGIVGIMSHVSGHV